jgi:N-acyl-phosphatidylethanolamine-hydrolysing phospholipase D
VLETRDLAVRRAHHRAGGGFDVPWPVQPGERGFGAFLRWRWQRLREPTSPRPPAHAFGRAEPMPASPRATQGELRITWIGHASFLIQIGRLNILTDPVWSQRVSPVSWAGPRRLTPPGLPFAQLPPIDAVLLSHDHYDHLDRPSVRRLAARFGAALEWVAPLGHADWLHRNGAVNIVELDWWQGVTLGDGVDVTLLPAQHWTRRATSPFNARLWGSFAIRDGRGAKVYFGGDSGWFDGYREIGDAHGPFDAVLMPIGAYEPRWFMRAAHMNPVEAVRAWTALGASGALVPMHWGPFQLSDEPPTEPPERLHAAWVAEGLPPGLLRILRHGETLSLPILRP